MSKQVQNDTTVTIETPAVEKKFNLDLKKVATYTAGALAGTAVVVAIYNRVKSNNSEEEVVVAVVEPPAKA